MKLFNSILFTVSLLFVLTNANAVYSSFAVCKNGGKVVEQYACCNLAPEGGDTWWIPVRGHFSAPSDTICNHLWEGLDQNGYVHNRIVSSHASGHCSVPDEHGNGGSGAAKLTKYIRDGAYVLQEQGSYDIVGLCNSEGGSGSSATAVSKLQPTTSAVNN